MYIIQVAFILQSLLHLDAHYKINPYQYQKDSGALHQGLQLLGIDQGQAHGHMVEEGDELRQRRCPACIHVVIGMIFNWNHPLSYSLD